MTNQIRQIDQIDTVKFLDFYRKMLALNPLTLEWLCGVVDGLEKGFTLGIEYGDEIKKNT